jgi:hypothetical protein
MAEHVFYVKKHFQHFDKKNYDAAGAPIGVNAFQDEM